MIDWLIHAALAGPVLAQVAVSATQSVPDAVNQLGVDFIARCLDLQSTAEQCIKLSMLPDPTTLIAHCKSAGMNASQCLDFSQAQATGGSVAASAPLAAASVPVVAAPPVVATAPVVASPPVVSAGSASSGDSVSLTMGPVVEWLLSIAAFVITTGVPIALTWARQHLRLMQDAVLAEQIAGAATRGAGLAAEYLQTAAVTGRGLSVDVKRSAVSLGVQYVLKSFPDAIAKLGASPDHIANMVIGELGKSTAPAMPIEQTVPTDLTPSPSATASADWPVAPAAP